MQCDHNLLINVMHARSRVGCQYFVATVCTVYIPTDINNEYKSSALLCYSVPVQVAGLCCLHAISRH